VGAARGAPLRRRAGAGRGCRVPALTHEGSLDPLLRGAAPAGQPAPAAPGLRAVRRLQPRPRRWRTTLSLSTRDRRVPMRMVLAMAGARAALPCALLAEQEELELALGEC